MSAPTFPFSPFRPFSPHRRPSSLSLSSRRRRRRADGIDAAMITAHDSKTERASTRVRRRWASSLADFRPRQAAEPDPFPSHLFRCVWTEDEQLQTADAAGSHLHRDVPASEGGRMSISDAGDGSYRARCAQKGQPSGDIYRLRSGRLSPPGRTLRRCDLGGASGSSVSSASRLYIARPPTLDRLNGSCRYKA